MSAVAGAFGAAEFPTPFSFCRSFPLLLRGASPCQVSVAVLLDNFINYTLKVEEEEKRKDHAQQRSRAEVAADGACE